MTGTVGILLLGLVLAIRLLTFAAGFLAALLRLTFLLLLLLQFLQQIAIVFGVYIVRIHLEDLLIGVDRRFEFTLQRQRVVPKAIYSVLGGASSQYRFLTEFPDAAQYVLETTEAKRL